MVYHRRRNRRLKRRTVSTEKPQQDVSSEPTTTTTLNSKRKYPIYNVLTNPSFPCVQVDRISSVLPPLVHSSKTFKPNDISEGSVGGNESKIGSVHAEKSVNTEEANAIESEEEFNIEDIDIADDVDTATAIIDSLYEQYVNRDPEYDTFHNEYFAKERSVIRDDPEKVTEFLISNRVVACFLAGATTAVNERLAGRIVRNFPHLIPDLIEKPEDEMIRLSEIFSPAESAVLASAFVDQFEDNGSFDGPLCCAEIEVLMMAEKLHKIRSNTWGTSTETESPIQLKETNDERSLTLLEIEASKIAQSNNPPPISQESPRQPEETNDGQSLPLFEIEESKIAQNNNPLLISSPVPVVTVADHHFFKSTNDSIIVTSRTIVGPMIATLPITGRLDNVNTESLPVVFTDAHMGKLADTLQESLDKVMGSESKNCNEKGLAWNRARTDIFTC